MNGKKLEIWYKEANKEEINTEDQASEAAYSKRAMTA